MTEIEFPHSHWCTNRDKMPANVHENIDSYFFAIFTLFTVGGRKCGKCHSQLTSLYCFLDYLRDIKNVIVTYVFKNLLILRIHLALAKDNLKIDKVA